MIVQVLGLYTLSGWTSYHKISFIGLEAATFVAFSFPIARMLDTQLSNSAGETLVKFQSYTVIETSKPAASKLHEILRQNILPLSE